MVPHWADAEEQNIRVPTVATRQMTEDFIVIYIKLIRLRVA